MFMATHLCGFGSSSAIRQPDQITGLQAWYKADVGITIATGVSNWADKSGNARDVAQGTAANQPTFVSSAVNGLPAVQFDGVNDFLVSGAFTTAQPLHAFHVAKQLATVTNGPNWTSSTTTFASPSACQETGPLLQLISNSNLGASVASDTTAYHLYSSVFNGTSSKIAKDNGSYQTSAAVLTGSMTLVSLGAESAGATPTNCVIAEFCLYNAEIVTTDLTDILNYFKARYALW